MTSAGPCPDLSGALGSAAEIIRVVGPQDTATALSSGAVHALGTPRLVAWLEAATCLALAPELPDGWTSVGVRVEMDHQRPSAVGATVVSAARVIAVEGARVTFEVWAHEVQVHEESPAHEGSLALGIRANEGGKQIARGRVTRAIVDSAGFHARLGA